MKGASLFPPVLGRAVRATRSTVPGISARSGESAFWGEPVRTRMIVAGVVLAMSLAGCAWFPGGTDPTVDTARSASAGCAAATARAPGTTTMNITSGGVARTYLQRIPTGYDATRPTPVVF